MISRELSQALLELRARVIARLLHGRVEISEDLIADALQRADADHVYASFNAARLAPRGPFALLRSIFFWR